MFVAQLGRHFSLLALLSWASFAAAQHHHHHHGGHFIDPGHYGHHHHSYYVRPHHHHQTVYYTYQNQSYYVPPVRPNAPLEQAPPPPELVTFGAFSHCKDLANRLDLLANELCLDLHYNYPHNRGFKETYREAYAILQLAKFVQGSDLPSNRDKLRESLQGLDRQFHHVQVDVKGWSRIHARQIGSLGIIEKTDQLESIIHHLLYDVGIEPQHDGPHVTTPGVREEAPPPQ